MRYPDHNKRGEQSVKIIFIRHGRTAGNLEKRYIGRTDEPLCKEGITELESIKYPDCDAVFASPMNRCLQTAKFIYPEKKCHRLQ